MICKTARRLCTGIRIKITINTHHCFKCEQKTNICTKLHPTARACHAYNAERLIWFPGTVENRRVTRDYVHNVAAARAWCVDRTTALTCQQAEWWFYMKGFGGPDLWACGNTHVRHISCRTHFFSFKHCANEKQAYPTLKKKITAFTTNKSILEAFYNNCSSYLSRMVLLLCDFYSKCRRGNVHCLLAFLIDYFGWSWHDHISGAQLQARKILGRL